MAPASFVRNSFLGGEWSKQVQGRTDRPDYVTALNSCVNAMPMEQGAWARRPGSRHCGTTRNGNPGRVINFDFQQSSPYTMELTDGFLRFRSGPILVESNDAIGVLSISTASPAVVTTNGNHGWSSGNQVVFPVFGTISPLLINRQFLIVVTAADKFTLTDAVTGAPLDGSTLTAGAFEVHRILEYATPYVGGTWSALRAIQADIPTLNSTTPGAVLLRAGIKPYVLSVVTPPHSTQFLRNASFSLAAVEFQDGPYFNPPGHGAQVTPSLKKGVISITLSFTAYDAARAYAKGDYVTYAANNYRSLVNANVGNQPDISPADWVAVSAGEVVGPNGFQTSDIGRHIRLYSEPSIYDPAVTYSAGDVVAFGGTGLDYFGATYYHAIAGSTGVEPGTDSSKWVPFPMGAIWTWGVITSLTNIISPATGANIGDMTENGGLAGAFNGNFSQPSASCAAKSSGTLPFGSSVFSSYVGKDYTASPKAIEHTTVYPSSDSGFANRFGGPSSVTSIQLNLRASNSLPTSSSDGTVLGTSGPFGNTTAPVTVVSSDQTTTWNYVWVEQQTTCDVQSAEAVTIACWIGEVSFVTPAGSGSTATGVDIEIRGDALLYTSAIRTWRLGIFSDTTGYPTCGTWHEGRLWLSGAIGNRIDGSRSNDPFNFAPTNTDGSVPANAAISYTFNAPDINPIFWMTPEGQGIVCGTQGGEWLVQATSNNLPLSPTTIQAHRHTKYNCANIEPRRTNLTLAVVQVFKRELLEYFADVFSGKFSAHDLAFVAKHLVASGIAEIAYQQELVPILWARMNNGSLAGCTYGRSSLVSSQPPDYAGWHRHTLGSGRAVESITVGGNTDGTLDSLYMVTNDPATNVRHVEMLTNVFLETDALAPSWHLDNAVAIQSGLSAPTPITGSPYGGMTLYGLWHLIGKRVSVTASGIDCGQGEFNTPPVDYLVANDGSVFVPYGDSVSAGSGGGLFDEPLALAALAAGQIVVGFNYNSDGQITRLHKSEESGARTGPAFGKKRRTHKYALLVANTGNLSVSTTFDRLRPVDPSNSLMPPGQTFTGILKDALNDDYTLDGQLCWRADRPLPAIVAAAGGFVNTQDEE